MFVFENTPDWNCDSVRFHGSQEKNDMTIDVVIVGVKKANRIIRTNWASPHWCPLCLMYVNGVSDFPNMIAEKTIMHTYGNPIWNSTWNEQDLFIGTRNSKFIRKCSPPPPPAPQAHPVAPGLVHALCRGVPG